VVGSGVFDVVGDEPLEPVRATLLGPIRVIPQEYPGLSCRYIDTRIGDPAAADLVWTELHAGPDAEPIVAVRGRHQWVPGFEAAHLPEPSDCPGLLRHNGVYLITGGTGGIGLALADYLATTARARLVLTGRGPLSDERGQAIEQLRARGAEVLYVQADVTDRDAMRAAVAQTRRQFGRIDGVVHAAGIPGGGIIALRTVVDAERVLSPKVLGTTVLREVLGDEPLDFVALCSSFTSLLGGAGQVDYCAANAFLDAFAHAETRAGRTTIAINWGVWQQVGMAVNTHVGGQLEDVKAANLRNGMRTTEGQAAFARILDTALPQVIVSPQDLPRLAAWYSTQRDAASTELEPDSELRSDSGSAPALHARPRVSSAFAAPRTDVEEQLCGVWRTLLGIAEVGIHDSFFDLGGHSLLATQLLARLQRLYGIELPLRTIFEAQTVAELADRIEAVRWAAAGRDDTAELLGVREEIEL
jgi:NAD(P)-dependent dehydrogenase (short-subunit alcohol dehydrogenase family)/acyl carrier protein